MAPPDDIIFFAPIDESGTILSLILAREIRSWGIVCVVDGRAGRLKKKLQWASDMRAWYAIIIGPDDIEKGIAQLRDMDKKPDDPEKQTTIPLEGLPRAIVEILLAPETIRKIEFERELAEFRREGKP